MSTYLKNTSPVFWGATEDTRWYKEVGIGGDGEYAPGPISITIKQRGNISHFPTVVRNTALDTVYNCKDVNNAGVAQGVLVVTFSVANHSLSVSRVVDPMDMSIVFLGDFIEGAFFTGSVTGDTAIIDLAVTLGFPEIVVEVGKNNWVRWSNIGSLDFTVWKDNIAGERPLDWRGWVYEIKKLGNKVVVYGENGVSLLVPSGNIYGLLPIHRIGLKGKQAVAGNDKVHFFVDRAGRLFRLGEIAMKSSLFESSIYPEKLDYSEYIASMSDLVLSWDELNQFLYICDGLSGYVYSVNSKSLGSGPANITGVGWQRSLDDSSSDAVSCVVASSTIINPLFEICTDINDLGSRKNKTIYTVELGTDVIGDLLVTLDYRKDKSAEFKTLAWRKVSPNGVTNIPCFGVEFRVRVKRTTYAYFELDYIRVNGIIHDYNFQYPYVGR